MENRLEKLIKYREERERKSTNTVGEASGRTYGFSREKILSKIDHNLSGIERYVEIFKNVLENSPVVIRDGELILGNYYYLIPYEIIELPMYFNSDIGVQASATSGHTVGNTGKLLKLGFGGIIEEIDRSLKKQTQESKIKYLTNLKTIIELMQNHIKKYSIEAKRLYDETLNKEYLELSYKVDSIVSNPPEDLHSAIILYFFYITFERTTSAGMGACRPDLEFYEFYKRDIELGIIDNKRTLELFQALLLKEGLFYSIGGKKEDGSDGANELTYIILDAYDTIGGPSNLGVKINNEGDSNLLERACQILIKHKTGVPIIINDDIVIESLRYWGFDEKQANLNCFAGCFWYVVPGKEYTYHDMEAISAVDILLNVLKEKEYESIDEIIETFKRKQGMAIDVLIEKINEFDKIATEICPEMVVSLLTDGCIEKGLDITNNGAEKSMTSVLYVGLATLVDSLFSLKKIVFEDKKVSYNDFVANMSENFQKRPDLKKIISDVDKFGSDNDEIDEFACMMVDIFKKQLSEKKNGKGFRLRPAFYSWNRHVMVGKRLGATPDGRDAFIAVSQGVNPSKGGSKKGLTALINSVSKIDFIESAGAPLHIHLSGDINKNILKSLIKASFEKGIMQIIANYVSKDTLIDAYKNPEKHWDLVIRVTGYSARFVQIDKSIQKEIIERYIY